MPLDPSPRTDPEPPRGRPELAWVVAGAFALRLGWILLVPSKPVGDFALYREAAAYLLAHGHLDPEFIYMPGYVFLLAAVQACGGGLLAAKMIGVVAGTLVVWSAGGIGAALFGARAGVIAAALAALWPAGIAVASVTGTDMPAAALLALGLFALARLGPTRPWLAAVLCGLSLGLCAWVRAVAVPLVAVSILYWVAIGARWRSAIGRAAVAVAVAVVVLLPWGLRNQRVYGELFLTDSHGGHTALVGSNPNSEGTYSRSLNLMFTKGTGYRLFDPPGRHRASDRAAYELAKEWTRFEPLYALGLVAAKADRLLGAERNLLYWPVFRAGVLPDDARRFFDARRPELERVADWFWWATVAFAAAGVAVARRRRAWPALALLAFPLALAGIYALFFSEVRYHLSIAPLLFPYAALAVELALPGASTRAPRARRRDAVVGALAACALLLAWQGVIALGQSLRENHRWAVSVCAYPYATRLHLCSWRRVLPRDGRSPVRGVWDGVGIDIGSTADDHDEVLASMETILPFDPSLVGNLHIRAVVSVTARDDLGMGSVTVAMRADDRVFARTTPLGAQAPRAPSENGRAATPSSARAHEISVALVGEVTHADGPLVLQVDVERAGSGPILDGKTIWISELVVERWPGLEIMPAR